MSRVPEAVLHFVGGGVTEAPTPRTGPASQRNGTASPSLGCAPVHGTPPTSGPRYPFRSYENVVRGTHRSLPAVSALYYQDRQVPSARAPGEPVTLAPAGVLALDTQSNVAALWSAYLNRPINLKGPLPWPWIAAASKLPGKALLVGLCIWRLAGATKSRTVVLGNADLKPLGIDRAAKSRALAALKGAGLISVTSEPGRFPTVTDRAPIR